MRRTNEKMSKKNAKQAPPSKEEKFVHSGDVGQYSFYFSKTDHKTATTEIGGRTFHHQVVDNKSKTTLCTADLVVPKNKNNTTVVVGITVTPSEQVLVLVYLPEVNWFDLHPIQDLEKLPDMCSAALRKEIDPYLKKLNNKAEIDLLFIPSCNLELDAPLKATPLDKQTKNPTEPKNPTDPTEVSSDRKDPTVEKQADSDRQEGNKEPEPHREEVSSHFASTNETSSAEKSNATPLTSIDEISNLPAMDSAKEQNPSSSPLPTSPRRSSRHKNAQAAMLPTESSERPKRKFPAKKEAPKQKETPPPKNNNNMHQPATPTKRATPAKVEAPKKLMRADPKKDRTLEQLQKQLEGKDAALKLQSEKLSEVQELNKKFKKENQLLVSELRKALERKPDESEEAPSEDESDQETSRESARRRPSKRTVPPVKQSSLPIEKSVPTQSNSELERKLSEIHEMLMLRGICLPNQPTNQLPSAPLQGYPPSLLPVASYSQPTFLPVPTPQNAYFSTNPTTSLMAPPYILAAETVPQVVQLQTTAPTPFQAIMIPQTFSQTLPQTFPQQAQLFRRV